MRISRGFQGMKTLLAILGTFALIGCGDAVAPALLVGSWTSATANIGSGYSRDERLTFGSDGVLEYRIRVYRNGQLESTTYESYVYGVSNDSLFTQPRLTQDGPVPITSFSRFNNSRLELDGSALSITYPWFGPADESVTVTQVFHSSPCRVTIRVCI